MSDGLTTKTSNGGKKAKPCPICQTPSQTDNFPFCSQRCKDIDLSRWLKGSYAIPAVEEDDPDDEDFA